MLFFISLFNEAQAQQACDTINQPVPQTWDDTSYLDADPFGQNSGYINGQNWESQYQKANSFDLTGTSFTYILGTMVKFGKANSANAANMSKMMYFRVYDASGKNGSPGVQIGDSAQKALSEIKTDVDGGKYTLIVFSKPLAIPANKKFYVSVDFRNFSWPTTNTPKDSIWIAGTADDQVKPNAAWTNDDNGKWRPYTQDYSNPADLSNDLDVTLWIFPQVSTSSSGCILLPVNLLSFNSTKNSRDVQLKWEISDEINMKGYEVEKANNNGNFQPITFVPALNSLKNQSYSITDRNAFATSTAVQYRLKQVDGDGTIKYSRVISMKSDASATDVVFANPFTGALKLQVTLAEQKQIAFNVFDMQGRLVAMQKPVMYNAATNTVVIPSTGNLKPGTYLLQINSGKEQSVYKIVKQ